VPGRVLVRRIQDGVFEEGVQQARCEILREV
jgi:hypothetical protein